MQAHQRFPPPRRAPAHPRSLPDSPHPPPAARPLAHSGFAAQSLTFRTGVRSHVLADSPHLPSTASSASASSSTSSSSSCSSSLPTSTRPLTLAPREGTHNQVGLRTGALGGLPLGRGGEGGDGHCASSSERHSACAPALRPASGRRPGRGLRARRRGRQAARA